MKRLHLQLRRGMAIALTSVGLQSRERDSIYGRRDIE